MQLRKAWQRMRGSPQDRPYNLLAISDLHLGCDLRGDVNPAQLRPRRMDTELVSFLDFQATHRSDGKPWRLILNGDIVDFIAITMTPPPGQALPFTVQPEERQYGLAAEEAKCVWKLKQVAERHSAVFDALARFIQRGNSLHFVRGNHDAEFHWPAVQAETRRQIAARSGGPRELRRKLEKQIVFHEWFYLEPGFFYAEHGNAHDHYCVQTGFFQPVAKAEPQREMDLPISSLMLRYFVNRYARQEDLDLCDTWGAVEYVKWVFKAGNPLQIAADYIMMVLRVGYPILKQSLRLTRMAARAAGRALRRVDEEKKAANVQRLLSGFSEASEKQARQLLAIASRPAEQSLFDSAQLFFVDRMLLALICLCGALAATSRAPTLLSKLVSFGLVGISFAGLNSMLARQRKTDAHPMLLNAARRVAQIFDVRYVVMGHSHRAVSEPVGATARYYNLGTWTGSRSEGFPHVVVERRSAELRRWRGPEHALAELAERERQAQPAAESAGQPMFPATA